MIPDPNLARRVDEAGINALPAVRHVLLGGWLLRFAGGCTRRANSVNPLWPEPEPEPRILRAQALYATQDLPCLFRLSSFQPPQLGALLDTHGYQPPEGETHVLLNRHLDGHQSPNVELERRPTKEWLQTQARLHANPPRIARGRRDMLAGLIIPAAFAAIRADGPGTPIAALGYSAVNDDIACINMVVTDPAARRRGLSRCLLGHLFAWSRSAGARAASLQVAADNTAALALYQNMGFTEYLYRYHYRRRPLAELKAPAQRRMRR